MYSTFISFLCYNLLFLGLQFLFILSKASTFLSAVPLPAIVYIELLLTFVIHIGLYISLSGLQTVLVWGTSDWGSRFHKDHWNLGIWVITVCLIITANSYYFPLSSFSELFSPPIPGFIICVLLVILLTIVTVLTLSTIFKISKLYPYITLVLVLVSGIPSLNIGSNTPVKSFEKPNLFIIGVDSLAPSRISKTITPTLFRFLNDSVEFKDTISPLARTFPAWVTILTGLYPFHHHAEENLVAKVTITSSSSFAWDLRKRGYHTIFATDGRRFNSLDKEFGFDKIIGPKLGVNEIFLGTFNDFPLSNLLINSPLGKWLFPYNHMNRESYFSYYPHTFDMELQHELQTNTQNLPLFLAVHFTLPHWPYAWAASLPSEVKDEYSVMEREHLYIDALKMVDTQVDKLLQELQFNGYLQNSLVILLSDHGEALYLPGSRKTEQSNYQGIGKSRLANYFKQNTSTALDMSAGHGSDLLSPDQFHCIFAVQIQAQGRTATKPRIINTRVSLIDIAPTINSFLNLGTHYYDGISLLHTINADSPNTPLAERAFVLESGMLPNQFLSRDKARELGRELFYVTKAGMLEQRKDKLEELYAMKLYGLIEGNWLFAVYPEDDAYIPVILRLSDNYWVDNLENGFSSTSPAQHMLGILSSFFQKRWDINNHLVASL